MPDHSTMHLGKLAPKHDPRTLRLEHYLAPEALPPTPATRTWDKGQQSWGVMRNDSVGCCTCSAAGHQIQVWTLNSGTEVTISDADVIAAYSAVTGYNPQTGANDNGAYELDVLNYWRKTGIGGHKLGAFADVQPTNLDMVKAAINLFGGVYIGLNLPISAQSQDVWDAVSGPTGQAGSWGGHAVVCIDYDAAGLTCITWGALKRMTWRFWTAYCDESHALIGPEWFNGQQVAPSGLDLAALTRDLAIVSGQLDPGPPPWTPDPTVLAWTQWETAASAYVVNQYTAGNVASARSEQALVAQYAPQVNAMLAGKAHKLPKVPPAVPA